MTIDLAKLKRPTIEIDDPRRFLVDLIGFLKRADEEGWTPKYTRDQLKLVRDGIFDLRLHDLTAGLLVMGRMPMVSQVTD